MIENQIRVPDGRLKEKKGFQKSKFFDGELGPETNFLDLMQVDFINFQGGWFGRLKWIATLC